MTPAPDGLAVAVAPDEQRRPLSYATNTEGPPIAVYVAIAVQPSANPVPRLAPYTSISSAPPRWHESGKRTVRSSWCLGALAILPQPQRAEDVTHAEK